MAVQYILGLDFGTDSVRAVVVNAQSGKEEANQVAYFKRWTKGQYCDPARNQFRQHPQDYIDSMEEAVEGALAQLPSSAGEAVAGIGIDTTGSTPCPVDRGGTPLALKAPFKDNPNAMFVLWKDHTAVKEAEQINELARSWGGVDYTKYEGGIYSSEWFWAKILHVLREDPKVAAEAHSWVEHADWMPALLTGNTDPLTLKRSRCAAGHKAMWHPEWDGLPSEEFLVKLDPLLKGLRERLFRETYTSDVKAGELTEEWAGRLGIPAGIAVAVGAFDAHIGAVGGGIGPATLTKIMGTSTCDMIVAPDAEVGDKQVAGICGQVDGSIVPGLIGLEAGQSAFGDVYAWLVNLLYWPLQYAESVPDDPETKEKLRQDIKDKLLQNLTEEAARIPPGQSGLLALDWLNGRRTPDADQSLKGAIIGLSLGTDAPRIFRALVEATAYGSRAIVERFRNEGVAIQDVVALGGIAQKSPFVMQVTADVLNMPIKVATSEQTCALGAAMFAAVAAGIYNNVAEAQEKMGSGFSRTYTPDAANAKVYDRLYEQYLQLGRTLEQQLREL
ncbi:MAG: ribulokinase [Spirochaetaceae bacterium]|nr:MAG: ribulokinase [Spirochaetaceae bacterium]